MATRFTEAEKGKQQASEIHGSKVKRIKAPSLNNEALIRDNRLTLIGRLTNPQEQKIWALLPALPRKWNLRGKVFGSDLGNNCFQFRFEKEEDLRRVLDNRPYHFAYWMVILQRWEPIISPSFPSMIPFWVKIRGLPLHYWHEDMIMRVAQELRTLENHELTKTTARIRVTIDGLKPLIKESIVEFDSGEESPITLEYERLEMHCSFCFSLLHPRKNCPEKLLEDRQNIHEARSPLTFRPASQEIHKPQDPVKLKDTAEKGYKTEQTNLGYRRTTHQPFQERVDRHGRAFGERQITKQTRNPPPIERAVREAETSRLTWRKKTTQDVLQTYNSPGYVKDRDQTNRSVQRGKDLFPQRSSSHKKPEQSAEHEVDSGLVPSLVNTHKEPNLSEDAAQYGTPKDQMQTREEVMEELQEVTRQYLNCPDPKEAAERRQRVLYSDANGLMEATASRILMATASQQALSLRGRSPNSNPNTPPPIQEKTFQEILGPDPSLIRSPQGGEDDEVDIGLDPYYSDISPNTEAILLKKRQDNAARIRSLIVNTSEVQKVSRGLSMKP